MATALISTLTVGSLLLGVTNAISVPSNIQNLYDSIVAQGECKNKAATGFYALDDGPSSNATLPNTNRCLATCLPITEC